MNHEGLHLRKCDFPHILKAALQHATSEIIINGFNVLKLVPWDPKKIVVTKQKTAEIASPSQRKSREIVTFFKILEEKIGKNKLISFEVNYHLNSRSWSGPIEQTDLYKS